MRETTNFGGGPLRWAALIAACLALLAIAAAPAHAAKGWGFTEVFGSANQPEFDSAAALALDESGDLLVIDASAGTVSRWHPDGTPSPFAALGTNVIDGEKGPGGKPCAEEAASCDETNENAGTADGGVNSSVAVDSSGASGEIYVTNRFAGTVDVFSSAGEFRGQLTEGFEGDPLSTSNLGAVAVDEAGILYLADDDRRLSGTDYIHKYDPAKAPPLDRVTDEDAIKSFERTTNSLAAGAGPSDGYLFSIGIWKLDSTSGAPQYVFGEGEPMAVDPVTGHLFARLSSRALEYDASGPVAPAGPLAEVEDTGSFIRGLAVVEGAEKLYLSHGSEQVEVYEAGPIPVVGIDPPTTVSGAKATVSGTVNPEGTEVDECFFEYGPTTAYGLEAPCNEAPPLPTDFEDHPVTAELTGMLANGVTYHYRLVAISKGRKGTSEDETLITKNTYTTDPATDVTESAATLNGTVKPEGVALTGCEFEWGESTDYGNKADCVPGPAGIGTGDADVAVSAAIEGLEPSTRYHFRLVAENELGQILGEDRGLFTQGAPEILSQRPIEVRQSSATLQAQINPAGNETTYHFEWGPEGSFANRIPASGELDLGSSGAEPVTVAADIGGLTPASRYNFRVVAGNAFGTTSGPAQPFETLNAADLPSNRGIELVSPADKGPAGMVGGFPNNDTQAVVSQAAVRGDSFLYPIGNGIPESTSGGATRWRAVLDEAAEGWLSSQVSAPALIPPPDGVQESPSGVLYASPDLGCAIVQTFNPLSADTPPLGVELGVRNLYRWNGEDGTYTLISDRVPLNPEHIGSSGVFYSQVEASADCDRVYFRSVYELIEGASGLYEWDGTTLRDAGRRPDGSTAANPVVGGALGNNTARWNAVSPAGRLFFSAVSNEGADSGEQAVFMREGGGAAVTDISQSQTAVATNGARFEAASPDGSTVFFRANYGIAGSSGEGKSSAGPTGGACGSLGGETNDSNNPPVEAKPCDLYAYDVESGELSDISADSNPADAAHGAQIQGLVAVSEDGLRAYFAALGQLIPGKGRTYAQNTAGFGSANVYLHDAEAGETSYVTTLRRVANLQGGDLFGSPGAGVLMRRGSAWSAHASADGKRLAFESTLNLTDYDSGGGRQAYLYDAARGEVSCISCPPDGGPTLLESNGRLLERSFQGFPNRARSISADGRRVFFSSPDVLAPGAVVGDMIGGDAAKTNVYQWQQGQVSFLATVEPSSGNGLGAYLSASADGKTAFIGTNEQLVPEDKDFVPDVYAFRVGGGFPQPPEPPPCQVDDSAPLQPNQIHCQGEKSPQPGAAAPPTARFEGRGDVKPDPCARRARRAQRLSKRAKALRGKARRARRSSNRKAARRSGRRAGRFARAARRNSKAAKRCRRGARAANDNRGGSR